MIRTLALAVCLALLLPAGPGRAQEYDMNIVTGGASGTYIQIGKDIAAIAAECGVTLKVNESAGSIENVMAVRDRPRTQLGIAQSDVLEYVRTFQSEDPVLARAAKGIRIVFPLYDEEIHVLAKNNDIRTFDQLKGKKVAVGPEKSGSALTAEVLLAGFDLTVERVFDAPEQAIKKLQAGEIDALIFIGGAPVPAFANLDRSFHFVALPLDAGLEQIYLKKTIAKSVYAWADAIETYAVPSVIMTRNRDESDYATTVQKLVLAILVNKENLDATGHPKWKDSYVRSTLGNAGYRPTTDVIQLFNTLESIGYRILKK